MIGVGLYQAYKGFARKFLDEVKTGEMNPKVRKGYTVLGVFGYVARAVVFVLVGYGLIKAAVDYDPKKAVGLDGALHELANSAYGPPVLWVVAVGLAGFALYPYLLWPIARLIEAAAGARVRLPEGQTREMLGQLI